MLTWLRCLDLTCRSCTRKYRRNCICLRLWAVWICLVWCWLASLAHVSSSFKSLSVIFRAPWRNPCTYRIQKRAWENVSTGASGASPQDASSVWFLLLEGKFLSLHGNCHARKINFYQADILSKECKSDWDDISSFEKVGGCQSGARKETTLSSRGWSSRFDCSAFARADRVKGEPGFFCCLLS